jgi:predicted DNA-binding transcriptional regulator YafY
MDALPGDKVLVLYQRLTLDGKRHFQTDIARDLGCSSQTVTRLVGVIARHLGKDASIECELEGRRRYYQLRSKALDKALGFSFEELHYLATCRDIAAQFLPESVTERIGKTLTALALHLSEGVVQHVSGQPMRFRNKGFIDYSQHLAAIASLRQAIDKRQICSVAYTASGRGIVQTYRYAPGRILAMGGTLYVQGYRLGDGSFLKERPTTFSLHRIAAIAPTGEYFSFDAADADARRFGLNWHPPKRVQVHIASQAADYVRDRTWSDDQTIEEQDDGSIRLAVSTTSEKELNAWVWSFGGLARIVDDHLYKHEECHVA